MFNLFHNFLGLKYQFSDIFSIGISISQISIHHINFSFSKLFFIYQVIVFELIPVKSEHTSTFTFQVSINV